ncbi:hypothetical protein StoSoilA2_33750 [Arthrobacter sp. StoSoilA2]|nr:hypothetical protein StoSoilA2_33750 [Arthrobacter sp. StoSoilA2]
MTVGGKMSTSSAYVSIPVLPPSATLDLTPSSPIFLAGVLDGRNPEVDVQVTALQNTGTTATGELRRLKLSGNGKFLTCPV